MDQVTETASHHLPFNNHSQAMDSRLSVPLHALVPEDMACNRSTPLSLSHQNILAWRTAFHLHKVRTPAMEDGKTGMTSG